MHYKRQIIVMMCILMSTRSIVAMQKLFEILAQQKLAEKAQASQKNSHIDEFSKAQKEQSVPKKNVHSLSAVSSNYSHEKEL
jgi:predicted transcriptional regulator YheO